MTLSRHVSSGALDGARLARTRLLRVRCASAGAAVFACAAAAHAQFSQLRYPGEVVATRQLPVAVATADMNGDGIDDIVTAHEPVSGPSTVVSLGRLDGTFVNVSTLSGPGLPSRVLVARVNGDAYADVVVVGTAQAHVYLGTATGQLGPPSNALLAPAGQPLFGGALADFDADGKLDLVVGTAQAANSGGILVCHGTGTGTFGPAQFVTLLTSARAVATVDFNQDGFTDVVAVNPLTQTVTAVLNTQGFGLLPTASFPVGVEPSDVAVGDLDGDGAADIVVSDRMSSAVHVLHGQPNALPGQPSAFFGPATSFALPTPAWSVIVADADADGRRDVLAALPGFAAVATLANDGAGGFVQHVSLGIGYSPTALATLDANADGRLDVVTTNSGASNVTLLFGDHSGTFATPARVPAPASSTRSVAFGDVDLDGKVDAVVATPSVRIRAGDGAGAFGGDLPINVTNACDDVYVAQLDATDAPEIVTLARATTTLRVLVRRAPGVYVVASETTTPAQPNGVAFADVDGNGALDALVTCGAATNACAVFLGDGGGGFAPGPVLAPIPGANGVRAGDFDGDGDLDLAVTSSATSPIQVFLGNGAGAFSAGAGVTGSDGATALVLADADEDGIVDVVAAETANRVVVRRGDGNGGFSVLSSWPFTSQPRAIAADDFDHDGHTDFAVCDATGIVHVLHGDGLGSYSLARRLFAGTLPRSLSLADFDGDTFADIAVLDAGLEWLSIHLQERFFRDCDANGLDDVFELITSAAADCDSDHVIDTCQIALGAPDCDANDRPDTCDVDGDGNGVIDVCETVAGTTYCFGDGSASPCPCNNASAPGDHAGCRNGTSQAARLTATGVPSLGADSVVFHVEGATPFGAILYFQGTLRENGGLGTPFGDGVRCVTGAVVRLATRSASGGRNDWPRSGDEHVSVRGNVPPGGGTRYYSALYRDASSFCTPSNFNYANGVELLWTP